MNIVKTNARYVRVLLKRVYSELHVLPYFNKKYEHEIKTNYV